MDLPPKLVSREVVKRERGITLAPPSSLMRDGRDSLPVLGAFGEFIEAERRRSRNRMLIMGGFFFLILLMVVGAGLLVGMLFFDRVRSDVHTVKNEMEGLRAQIQNDVDGARKSVSRLEAETKSLLDGMAQHEEALANTRSTVDAQKADYEQELADMKQLLELLEVENTALKRDMQLVTTRLPQLAGNVDRLLATVGDLPSGASVKTGAAQGGLGLPASFELSLLPAGGSRSYSWRLPIPE